MEALHCLAGKLSRDWMVGEGLAEVDQSVRRWHVPPIEKVVKLKTTNERKMKHSLAAYMKLDVQ